MDFKDLAANKRQPNTGQWILDVPEFNAWARGGGSSNTLWCYGDRMCRALDFLSTGVHSWCWEDRYCVRISCTPRRKQGAFSAQLSSNIFMHAHRMRAGRVLSIFSHCKTAMAMTLDVYLGSLLRQIVEATFKSVLPRVTEAYDSKT